VRCISMRNLRAGDIYHSSSTGKTAILKHKTLQECFEEEKSGRILTREQTTTFLNNYLIPLWNYVYKSSAQPICPLPNIDNLDLFETGIDKSGFINLFWLLEGLVTKRRLTWEWCLLQKPDHEQ